MPYLVDGDNLLGTWRGRSRSDAERRRLAFELDRFARRSGREVLLVFDGVPAPGLELGPGVRFSGRQSADAVILERLRSSPEPQGWMVVTSDRSLGDRCRWLGARVERSDLFRRRLAQSTGGEKPEREDDLEHWLSVFEGDPGDDVSGA